MNPNSVIKLDFILNTSDPYKPNRFYRTKDKNQLPICSSKLREYFAFPPHIKVPYITLKLSLKPRANYLPVTLRKNNSYPENYEILPFYVQGEIERILGENVTRFHVAVEINGKNLSLTEKANNLEHPLYIY